MPTVRTGPAQNQNQSGLKLAGNSLPLMLDRHLVRTVSSHDSCLEGTESAQKIAGPNIDTVLRLLKRKF